LQSVQTDEDHQHHHQQQAASISDSEVHSVTEQVEACDAAKPQQVS